MQKNPSSYTFLLKHSFKTKNNIRKIEVSKKLFHTSVALILTFGIFSIAFAGFNTNINLTNLSPETVSASENAEPVQNNSRAEYKSINYARPEASEDFAINTGGPESTLQMTPEEAEAGERGMTDQIRQVEKTSSQTFLPTIWAHMGKINNEFGYRRNPFGGRSYEFHSGMDIDGETGDIVVAPANGKVTNADWQGGYGNMIEIDHGNGLVTRYGHLSRIGVQAGDTVQRGQVIGLVGSTGRSTGPHLHYELRLNDKPINPRRFLPPVPTQIRTLNRG